MERESWPETRGPKETGRGDEPPTFGPRRPTRREGRGDRPRGKPLGEDGRGQTTREDPPGSTGTTRPPPSHPRNPNWSGEQAVTTASGDSLLEPADTETTGTEQTAPRNDALPPVREKLVYLCQQGQNPLL